jgi:hypothetical protein
MDAIKKKDEDRKLKQMIDAKKKSDEKTKKAEEYKKVRLSH